MGIMKRLHVFAILIAAGLLATLAMMIVLFFQRATLLDLEQNMTRLNRDAFRLSRDTGNLISSASLLEGLFNEWKDTAARLHDTAHALPNHKGFHLVDDATQRHIRIIGREWEHSSTRLEELEALLETFVEDRSIVPRQKRGIAPTIQHFLSLNPIPYETVESLNRIQTLLTIINNVLMPRVLEGAEGAYLGTNAASARVTRRLFMSMGVFLVLQILLILVLFLSLVDQRAAQRALQEAHDTLEEKVQERTEELHTSNEELQASTEELEATNITMLETNERLQTTITYLNQMREKVIEQEKLASLGGLVAGIAHEINTPVGSALTAITFLRPLLRDLNRKLEENTLRRADFGAFLQDAEESVRLAEHNLTRASDLVASFKKISVDQSADPFLEFDIATLIHDVLLSLRHEYKSKPIQVRADCPEPGTVFVKNYPGALVQVLTNLIMNSIRHGLKDTQDGCITLKVQKEEDQTLLFFSDNGCGMTEEVRAHAFDPFFTTARGSGGTGLGMSMVYNLVTQKMGGTLEMQTQPGEGVHFLIRIPPLLS